MKTKILAKIFGNKKRSNFDASRYISNHKSSRSRDYLEDKKLVTRQGHLE